MQELIDKIISRTGISKEQADHVLETIKAHVIEKFPAFAGTLESMLGNKEVTNSTTPAVAGEEGFMQKATHFVQDHAGDVSGKAKELFTSAEDKIKGMFS